LKIRDAVVIFESRFEISIIDSNL